MFLVPVLVYLILIWQTKTIYSPSLLEYVLLFVQGAIFSYLGNVFSLRGIELAPNPGYSLIISKSYVVFTAIASVFLFNSPLPITSIIAIFFIVAFSALIMIDKNGNQETSGRSWIIFTMGSFFCWGLLALTAKYLYNLGMPVLTRLTHSMLIVVLMIFAEMRRKRISLAQSSRQQLVTLLLIGLFASSFNYFMQIGILLAPNVGFVNSTNTASISLLTLMSAWLFKDHLSLKKMIGVAGVTVGLGLLFL